MNYATDITMPTIDQIDAADRHDPNAHVPLHHKLFLNAAEVALYVGISRRAVFRAVSGGDLPKPYKLGSRSLWHRPTLERFFDERVGYAERSRAG